MLHCGICVGRCIGVDVCATLWYMCGRVYCGGHVCYIVVYVCDGVLGWTCVQHCGIFV